MYSLTWYCREQGEPDLCCHPTLCCAAGTAVSVRVQGRTGSTGGRDRNWKDVHCTTSGQSYRWAQVYRNHVGQCAGGTSRPPILRLLVWSPCRPVQVCRTENYLLSLLILICFFVRSSQDTDCALWTWTSRVTLPTSLEGEWPTNIAFKHEGLNINVLHHLKCLSPNLNRQDKLYRIEPNGITFKRKVMRLKKSRI